MVIKEVIWDKKFESTFKKIKDKSTKNKIRKQIAKVIKNPEAGKFYRYGRKGERCVYIGSHRLFYAQKGETLIILAFLSKDELRREH